MAVDWQLVQLLLAILVAIALPIIVQRWVLRARDGAKTARATATLREYMQQGLSELDAKFQVAVDFVASQVNAKLSNEQRLTLYAFYKQAVLGKCDAAVKPSAIDMAARAKWESWMALGGMARETAKQQYFGLVQELFPHFDETGEAHARGPHALADQIRDGEKDEAQGMAGVVSMPTVDLSAPEWQVTEDMFHFASIGQLTKVEEALARGGNVDAQDDEGRTMLHWAVDRSKREVAELLLLKHKASPNVQDAEGMTPLHYAVSCEDEDLAELLVAHGAFTDLEDNDGETPLAAAPSEALEAILVQGKTRQSTA